MPHCHLCWPAALSVCISGCSGAQVLIGDVEDAICLHAFYYAIWKRYGALPERYNWQLQAPDVPFYPLRPELVESTYLLYQVSELHIMAGPNSFCSESHFIPLTSGQLNFGSPGAASCPVESLGRHCSVVQCCCSAVCFKTSLFYKAGKNNTKQSFLKAAGRLLQGRDL